MKTIYLFLFLTILITSCSYEPSNYELETAASLINEIDAYKALNNKSPLDEEAWKIMGNLGLDATESCRPCYQQQGDTDYIVYFGMQLGESYTYNSKTGSWQ